MNKQTGRKPFVVPQIKEEASLATVTLTSGGGHVRGFCKKGQKNNNRYGNTRFGSSSRRGH